MFEFYTDYTLWQFGLGFARKAYYMPRSLALFLGPWTLEIYSPWA